MAHKNIIQNPRNGCALHGALSAVQAINGAVPIVHANPGCSVINYLAGRDNGNSYGKYQGFAVPGTTVQERHIIFGGASRLREQLKNTVKVVDGDLYVVLNSCESAMVGDDVDAMTREIVEQGEPVVDTLVAGFNGGFQHGYERVLADIFNGLVIDEENLKKEEKLVNIFGLIPGKDPFLYGNLEELKRILFLAGIKSNTFFGLQNGVDELKSAGKAAASIVFSRWGELPASILNKKYNVPVILKPSIPVGAEEVIEFLKTIGDVAGISSDVIEKIYEDEKKYEDFYFQNVIENIVEDNSIISLAIVAEEEAVIRYGNFFKNKLGIEIGTIVLTDALAKDGEHETDNSEIIKKLSNNIVISQDKKAITDSLIRSGVDLIIGSSLESSVAEKLGVPLLEISYPQSHRKILNKAHAGIKGEISLLEDYVTVTKDCLAVKKVRLLEKIKENN